MRTTWFGVGVCLIACSSQGTPDDGGTDANANDGSVDAAADVVQEAGKDGGAGCNALVNAATVIDQLFVATAAASGDGGTLVSGTYFMTAASVYTGVDGGAGPTGTTFAETLVMDGGAYERVQIAVNDAGADGSPYHANGNVTINGASVQVNQTCPILAQPFTTYDSNGTKLHIYAPPAGSNPGIMFEYTKQ